LVKAKKGKSFYKLYIPSPEESQNISSLGLIVLYSLNNQQVVMCRQECIETQEELFVFDKDKMHFIRYEKLME
jgi:hypothetical protein